MKRSLTLLIVCFFCLASSFAQDSVTPGYPVISKQYLKSYFSDSRDLVLSPLSWNVDQWTGLGLAAVSGLALYTQDNRIREFALNHQHKALGSIARYGLEPWGSGLYSLPLLGGMYIFGSIKSDKRLSATALTAVKAACVSAVLVNVFKQLAHRYRPYDLQPPDPGRWEGPFGDFHNTSFPSGHSVMAFSIASVLASEYRKTVWVPAAAYTLAGCTALSRVYSGRHWATDVVAGSALGYLCGRYLWKKNLGVHIVPVYSSNYQSLSLIFPVNSSGHKRLMLHQ